MRILGGALGGQRGGVMPDVIEPASWPGHRQVAHSVAGTAAMVYYAEEPVTASEEVLHRQALDFRRRRIFGQSDAGQEALLLGGELLAEFAAGMPSGFVAGYVSHVMLDAVEGKIPAVGDLGKTIEARRCHRRRQT
jgi:hypothetical protein